MVDMTELMLAIELTQRPPATPIRRSDRARSIAVTDTGLGIPVGQLQDIFQHFTQADSSTPERLPAAFLLLHFRL